MAVYEATTSAPVNIAVIKYWGKRDVPLNLPTNSSLSVTLSQDHLRSTTSARAAPTEDGKDRLWLNGEEVEIKGRMADVIRELRALKGDAEVARLPLHIVSYNNFPTAAGLASSASGFAALVYTLATLYALPLSPSALSAIARRGSGSACRSLFGGFVAWEMGSAADGKDSLAVEVAPRSHWPEMQALICVVSAAKKGTPSTAGMQATVATSPLLAHRVAHVVPQRMADMEAAIKARDFDSFAKITMADSNQFHAVCLDTAPPIFYLSDVSRALIALVNAYNDASVAQGGGYKAAYTFDAGPNAVIYAEKKHIPEILALVQAVFPPSEEFTNPFGVESVPLPEGVDLEKLGKGRWEKGAVSRLIHTEVGDGPRVLAKEESLLNERGLPKTLNQ